MEPPVASRLKLTVHYDGRAFHGWQLQPDQRTVQGELEAALSRLADRRCRVIGAGRTDTGVHAMGQVAAVDLPAGWTASKLHRSLNAVLPDDVWVSDVEAVHPRFHPRYDAVARTYTYDVGTAPEAASPFHRGRCWPLGEALDASLLAEAADLLEGEHSFGAFAKSGQPERGDRCHVMAADWSAWALGVRFTITADRYLHHMVRYLVGTMVDVGRGRRPLDDVAALLANAPGVTTSPPAPPQGLVLQRVEYPPTVQTGPRPTPARSGASA